MYNCKVFGGKRRTVNRLAEYTDFKSYSLLNVKQLKNLSDEVRSDVQYPNKLRS